MKYDKDKKWVRKVLQTANIVNTLNGGISKPIVGFSKMDDHYLLKARIPGVDAEDIKVEIMDDNLMIYHDLEFKTIDNAPLMVPHVVASCQISNQIDHRNISASMEGNVLHIYMPINDLKKGFSKKINIKRW